MLHIKKYGFFVPPFMSVALRTSNYLNRDFLAGKSAAEQDLPRARYRLSHQL